jgi:hypothetical protein
MDARFDFLINYQQKIKNLLRQEKKDYSGYNDIIDEMLFIRTMLRLITEKELLNDAVIELIKDIDYHLLELQTMYT